MSEIAAYVARSSHTAEPAFLKVTESGQLDWVMDPSIATSFESVREATRRASRLPASLRAFGMLRRCERPAR